MRVIPARWVAGFALVPLRLQAAGETELGHVMGSFDLLLIFGAGLTAGLIVWLAADAKQKRLARAAANRIQRMTALVEHADCLLWEAEVELKPTDWLWRMTLHNSAFCRKMFRGTPQTPGVDLWQHFQIETREEMNRRARDAMEGGQPGYEQEFRAVRAGQVFWMHENVSITPVGRNRFWLVGVVTDITAQREAEEARQRSEMQLTHLLERADSMLWQAKVRRQEGGRLLWTMFIPKSQVYRRIFSGDPENPVGFAWDKRGVPEDVEMDHRAVKAINEGSTGYDQVFHVPSPMGDIWLNETVTIVPAGPDSWDLVGIITDITARHRAEEASRESQERLRKLLALADCLLWEAKVELTPAEVRWDISCYQTGLTKRIFGELPPPTEVGLWYRFTVPERPDMDRRAREALENGWPGYEQQFRLIREGETIWINESVTITPTGPNKFWLVGLATDITVQRASDLRLAALLDRADCMIWQGEVHRLGSDDFQWKVFTPSSQLYRRLFGGDPSGECHFPWDSGLVPEQPAMKERAQQALAGGLAGYEQSFHYKLPMGEVWLSEQVTIKPVAPDHWELVGVITDITERRKSEAARQASEQRLSELLSRADCLLWESTVVLQPSGWRWDRHILPSLLYRRLTGAPLPEPTEAMWPVNRVPERSEMDQRCREALLSGRLGYEQVFHFVKENGEEVWISENVTVHRLDDRRYWLVGVAVDITPQRRAEEALAAEKERLSVTLRAMSESVITTDVDGCIRFMNPAAATLTEWSVEECIGRPVQEICRLHNSRNDQVLPVGSVAKGDQVVYLPLHTRLATRRGHNRLVEGCCAPIHAADSKVTGTVLVFRDVTEQDRLEQELVRATRLESVGVLAGGIAHDFNNILTAVMGNLTLAQLDVPANSSVAASLRSAEKAALRARDLTQQLLTFAKGGEPVRAAVQLDAIIREMTSFALHGSKVRPHYDLAPDLWPADADKGQIGRVVQNLVINAVQAMPHGGTLQIVVRNDPLDGVSQPGLAPGDYIQIAISDTGEGIKPEHLARIFDPYFTTKQTGTGLGLAAVYSIVKKHRGHIEVDSQPGQGTTFRLWLPALRDRATPSDSRKPWGEGTAERMKGRVLFMDDEQSIREMAVGLLQRFGLTVDCAADGAEAVEKYRTAFTAGQRYDLVIMDLTVPGGMGGLAALGKLREIDPAVKAVVSSGYSSDPVLANFRAHGFAAMVAKPYEVHEISRVLREVLPGV